MPFRCIGNILLRYHPASSHLNHRLKLRRNEAKEDLIVSGEGIPPLLRWGLNGKADEFWSANDFEILGACYWREVENFLAF